MTYEQKLKQEKRKHDRIERIRRANETVKAERMADIRARYEFNQLMKERGVVL